MAGRNRIPLYTEIDGELVSHFSLHEFENRDGLTCVNPTLLRSLELLRVDLCREFGKEIEIAITSGTRTEADNRRLAQKYGWKDEGGIVSRDSQHMPKHGGVAADFIARSKEGSLCGGCALMSLVPMHTLYNHALKVFDYVSVYFGTGESRSGHVHGDNRDGGKKLESA